MTQPTQEQIEAAAKAIQAELDPFEYDLPKIAELTLTAAAQVGEQDETLEKYCEVCGGEGRILTSRYGGNDPDTIDTGPCRACNGTGRSKIWNTAVTATIERCAQVADSFHAYDTADAIRKLKDAPMTNTEKLACARRELALRKGAYPKWVKSGRMKQVKADYEIAAMAEIVADYERAVYHAGERAAQPCD